jgi:putative membrane protein
VAASLANERSHLAWQRTAMSWVGAGAVVTRYFASDGFLRAETMVGVLMVLAGSLMWLAATRRYHRAHLAIRAAAEVPVPTRTIQVVWVTTVLVVLAALGVELFR